MGRNHTQKNCISYANLDVWQISAIKTLLLFFLGFFIFSDALSIIKTLILVAKEKTASNVAKSNGSWIACRFNSFVSKLYLILSKFYINRQYWLAIVHHHKRKICSWRWRLTQLANRIPSIMYGHSDGLFSNTFTKEFFIVLF